MANIALGVTVVSGGVNGANSSINGYSPNSITAAQLAKVTAGGTNWNNTSSTMATLVADGASPTSAHVSACNSAYAALMTDLAAVTSGGAAAPDDIYLAVNTDNVTTKDKLFRGVRKIERQLYNQLPD